MSAHAQAHTRSTQKYARTTRHETSLLSTTLRAHAPKQPTTPHSRATPAPTQAHQRCPRATARSSTATLTRSAPSRHCPAGGKGAIRQTRGGCKTQGTHTRAPANPPSPAHTSTRTRIRARRVSTALVGAGYGAGGGHGGRALDRGAGAHKATESQRSREAAYYQGKCVYLQDGVEPRSLPTAYDGCTNALG